MNVVLTVLHVLVCFFLIAVVLLQRGKGAEMGAVFGGGASSTVFGSRGGANFLTKMTTASAALFMITSLTLSYISTDQATDKLFEDGAVEEAAAESEGAAGGFEDLGKVAPESAGDDTGLLTNAPAAEAGEAAPDSAGDTPKP